MLFQFFCTDFTTNTTSLRQEYLVSHLQWVESNMASIRVAGPRLDDDERILGSLYIIEAETKQRALKLLESDPYHQAAIWQSITCTEFKAYAGTWVGGKNWPS